MRTKLLSVFLGVLMLSGIVAPLLLMNGPNTIGEITPVESMNISDISSSWHDDCSNTTGWVENNTYVENLIQEVQSGISLFSDGDGIYSDTIPSSTTDLHGPQFFKKLPSPMVLRDNLDLQVEISHVGPDDRMGAVGVVLLDEFNASIFKAGGGDGSYTSTCTAWVAYKEGVTQNTEYHTMYGEYNGTVRVWYDASTDSIKGDAAGMEVTLATSGSFSSDRSVHFISVVFYTKRDYTYESYIVKDILLTTSTTLIDASPWYHDCSNTTAFDGVADDTWYGNPDIHVDGSIASTDGYIYASDYGSGSVSYGPMLYHNLTNPFNLTSFESLSSEFEFEDSTDSRMGAAAVVLFDQNNDTVITINVADSWSGYSVVSAFASYDFANGTRLVTPWTNPTWTAATPYREMISVIQNATGIYAFIPRVGNFEILPAGSIETDRNITSIAVNFRASASASISEVNRIHEIYLNKLPTQTPTDSTPPTIDDSPDFSFEAGSLGQHIDWNPSDLNPDRLEITLDSDIIISDDWGGGSISLSLGENDPGIYVYELTVFDFAGNNASDAVTVTVVDTTDPFISGPLDFVFTQGDIGNIITWYVSDFYPESFTIVLDSTTVLDSGSWTTGTLEINVDDLSVGIHLVQATVEDESGNLDDDIVQVTVLPHSEPEDPEIDSPLDIAYILGTTGHEIEWTPYSATPATFQLYLDGALIDSGSWNGSQIIVDVDGLAVGIYNYTLYVYNEVGDSATDSVFVVVSVGGTGTAPPGGGGDIMVIAISIGSFVVIIVIIGAICRNKGTEGSISPPSSGYKW